MPDESKKNDKRNAKEQRKSRHRHQQAKADKKPETVEEPKTAAPKVTVPQQPPVYESPPPEFYKNLKRETDEILKITEEENAKYKKKEIQSNWSKYEVPIDSYDEIDEQENLGADYEKVIEASLSAGGHFQFKHEKSWDMNTGPSQYDKYFDINMEDLNIALCTIPFSKRNDIEEPLFSESDVITMTNRSTRFKQKYYNDKSYSTPETVVQDNILKSLREGMKSNVNSAEDTVDIETKNENEAKAPLIFEDKPAVATDIKLKYQSDSSASSKQIPGQNSPNVQVPKTKPSIKTVIMPTFDDVIEHDDFIFRNIEKPTKIVEKTNLSDRESPDNHFVSQKENKETPTLDTRISAQGETEIEEVQSKVAAAVESKVVQDHPVAESPVEAKKNPVFESPEDLEKWLDDYLDG